MNGDLTLELDLDELYIELDKSVPVGLIINELIVNVLKHAFPDKPGVLKVKLKRFGEKICLVVEDNSQGFSLAIERNSLGLELIHMLSSELDGEINFDSGKTGTKWEITFSL